jgi:uncharacterized protein (TIGR02217 family)
MSITIYNDVIMPNTVISAGIAGKQVRNNTRTESLNGSAIININWTKTLRQYELGIVPMRIDQWQAIEGLHEVTDGGAYGFLMEDPKDGTVDDAHGMASLISAGSHTYQLFKRYTSIGSSRYKDRNITRPKASTFKLYISGVPSTSYTLNADTGVITIASDPSANTISWSGSFYVPVHFENDSIDWELVVAGQQDTRFLAGPSVVLMEVRE